MGKCIPVFVALLVVLGDPGLAASAVPADFARISGAIAAGQGAQAQGLADTALAQPGLEEADRSRLLLYRALASQLQQDRAGALADFTRAINARALPPDEQARAYVERGLLLDGMDRLADAAGDYGAALSLIPGSAAALNNRANVFRRQKRFEDARRDYLASLAADNPAPEYPYFGLGQVAEGMGRPQEARDFYAKALAANPGYSLASQRLTALGGAPGAAPAIVLRPPKAAPEKAVSPSDPDAPLVLRPPVRRAPARQAAQSAPVPSAANLVTADERPGLRPALDNSADNDGGGSQVQLGAWRSRGEAQEGWQRAVRAAGGALEGLNPRIVTADIPGRGRYYRLRVATADAAQLCAALIAKGQDCLAVRD